MIQDFWRINKQNQFVIAGTPGYDEYTGITDEIIQELEACGDQSPFDYLVEKLSRVYGVKESSVGAYLNTPMFTKDDDGIIRVHDSGERIDVSTDITKKRPLVIRAVMARGIGAFWSAKMWLKGAVASSRTRLPNCWLELPRFRGRYSAWVSSSLLIIIFIV